jgi:hypothetical protein
MLKRKRAKTKGEKVGEEKNEIYSLIMKSEKQGTFLHHNSKFLAF